jgi:hypothetical protein
MPFWKRLIVALFAAMVMTSGAVIATPQVVVAQDEATTCAQELQIDVPSAEDVGKTPTVLIHGRGSDGGIWSQGSPSMKATLQSINEAHLVEAFDYESESTKWVAGSDASYRLAKTIVCYYLLYGEGVAVVAHSMGGLLTYETLNMEEYGVRVSEALGHIASIGSPFQGSWLATGTFEAAVAFCKLVGMTPIGQLAMEELCREVNSDWSTSGLMSYDSGQLEALPDLPEGITHKAIAGRIQMEVCFFACAPFSIGDSIVPSESATARYTDTGVGDGVTIFDCTISEGAWCEHGNMLQAEQVQQEVKASLEAYIASQHVEMTNLHGLELSLGDEWELSYMTLYAASEMPYSTVVNTELCTEPEANDYCHASFTVVDAAAYAEWMAPYPQGEGCPWYSLRDGLWHTSPKITEEVTIGGKPATYRIHWQCDSDGNGNATPPQSADAADDVMHSWEIDDIVVVDQDFESDEPLAGLEGLLAGAGVS